MKDENVVYKRNILTYFHSNDLCLSEANEKWVKSLTFHVIFFKKVFVKAIFCALNYTTCTYLRNSIQVRTSSLQSDLKYLYNNVFLTSIVCPRERLVSWAFYHNRNRRKCVFCNLFLHELTCDFNVTSLQVRTIIITPNKRWDCRLQEEHIPIFLF